MDYGVRRLLTTLYLYVGLSSFTFFSYSLVVAADVGA
jgi:hypothetical protein